MARTRVVVAMSGGVDSSVAAALLVEQGYEVVGIMLRLWSEADNGKGPANRCCALDAQHDAERVARSLDIPFYLVNMAGEFKRRVVDYFVAEYAAGRTPNPCVECNRQIRFDLLLHRALTLDAQYLATGHYARVRRRGDRYQLCRGVDRRKDQSYVLHVLSQDKLAHALFPVGEHTKAQVRETARERGLPVAERGESQNLCFVGDGDYRRFLSKWAPEAIRPGPIRDSAGRVLGQHRGLALYTIGQRKGLGISAPEPLYVLALEAVDNALIVGTAAELGRDVCLARRINWIAEEPPGQVFAATAKIRYKAHDAPVTVTITDNGDAHVQFDRPQRDITPGQTIVFYQDEVVLGGGTIAWGDQNRNFQPPSRKLKHDRQAN
jgi:tRNA-specific 2-thiouridylase